MADEFRITHIDQIISYILPKFSGRIIIGFDWDNCISLISGCYLPLRDPITIKTNGDGTRVLETFEELNQRQIPYFVITSRLQGLSIEQISQNINWFPSNYQEEQRTYRTINCIKESIKFMQEAVPQLSPNVINNQLPGLNPSEPIVIPHKHLGEIYATSIVFENVIFAGSEYKALYHNKGKAIINCMALGILPSADQFDYFICVDDTKQQLDSIKNAFEEAGIDHKLICIWYPQRPMIRDKNLCIHRPNIDNCLLNDKE
jgi:hypothetical protein